MRRTGTSLMVGAVLAFIASLLIHGLSALGAQPHPVATESDPIAALAGDKPVAMIDILLVPHSAATLSLLAVLGCGLAYHALRRWNGPPRRLGERQPVLRYPAEAGPAQHAPLILGLLAGAVWPWLSGDRPFAAFALSAVMAAGLVLAALTGLRQGGRVRNSGVLSFAAGWAVLASCAMLAALIERGLGLPVLLSACIGLSLAALITVSLQLRLGKTISASVAVIWGLIAIAVGSMTASVGLATLAVLAIAVIAFALVQVLT